MSAITQKVRKPRAKPLDGHIGQRLRQRRTLIGMSQEKLADAVGLTFQQIQKYEKGTNRIGASRLWQFCRVLDVPPSYFFEAISSTPYAEEPMSAVVTVPTRGRSKDPLTRRQTLELVRAYYRISDPNVRRNIFDLVKNLSEAGQEAAEAKTA